MLRIERTASGDADPGVREPQKTKSIVVGFFTGPDGSKLLAEKTGKIKVGDVLVSLNGKGLEGTSTGLIIAKIREANAERPLQMTFRRDSNQNKKGKQAISSMYLVQDLLDSSYCKYKYAGEVMITYVVCLIVLAVPFCIWITFAHTIGQSTLPFFPDIKSFFLTGPIPRGAMIRRFKPLKDGKMGPAERCGMLKPSMILESCNGTEILGQPFQKIMSLLKSARRPIVLRFRHDPDVTVTFRRNGALGLRLAMFEGLAIVTGFVQQPGQAERPKRVKQGHVLLALEGQ